MSLDYFRQNYPDQFDGLNDYQAVLKIAKTSGVAPDEVARQFRVEMPTLSGELAKGVSRGVDQIQGMGYAGIGWLGDVAGVDSVRDFGLRGAKRNAMEAAQTPAAVDSYKDVGGLRDALLYASGGTGEMVPQVVSSLIPGALGAKLAVASAVKAGGTALAKDVARKEILAEAAQAGAMRGGAAYGIGSETANNYADIYEKTGEHAPGISLAYGVPGGLLEGLSERMLFKDMAKGRPKDMGRMRYAGQEAGKQFLTEGVLEELPQTALSQSAVRAVDPSQPYNVDEMIDATLKGGIGGGVIGGGSGLLTRQQRTGTEREPGDWVGKGIDLLHKGADMIGRREAKQEIEQAKSLIERIGQGRTEREFAAPAPEGLDDAGVSSHFKSRADTLAEHFITAPTRSLGAREAELRQAAAKYKSDGDWAAFRTAVGDSQKFSEQQAALESFDVPGAKFSALTRRSEIPKTDAGEVPVPANLQNEQRRNLAYTLVGLDDKTLRTKLKTLGLTFDEAARMRDEAEAYKRDVEAAGKRQTTLTPEGEELRTLSQAWLANEAKGDNKHITHLFDGSDEANELGTKLFAWIKHDFGRSLNVDEEGKGHIFVPKAFVDVLGEKAPGVVQSAIDAARKEGWDIKDAGDAVAAVKDHVLSKSSDVAAIENSLRYSQAKNWDGKMLERMARELREKKGQLGKDDYKWFRSQVADPDKVLDHFRKPSGFYAAPNKARMESPLSNTKAELDTDGENVSLGDNNAFSRSLGLDEKADITDNDAGYGSGVNEFDVDKTRVYPMAINQRREFYDMRKPEDKALIEKAVAEALAVDDGTQKKHKLVGIIERTMEKRAEELGVSVADLDPRTKAKITRDLVHEYFPSFERVRITKPKGVSELTLKDYEKRKEEYEAGLKHRAAQLDRNYVTLAIDSVGMGKLDTQFHARDVEMRHLDLKDPRLGPQRGTLIIQGYKADGTANKEPFKTSAPMITHKMFSAKDSKSSKWYEGKAQARLQLFLDGLASVLQDKRFGNSEIPAKIGTVINGEKVWLDLSKPESWPKNFVISTDSETGRKLTIGEALEQAKEQAARTPKEMRAELRHLLKQDVDDDTRGQIKDALNSSDSQVQAVWERLNDLHTTRNPQYLATTNELGGVRAPASLDFDPDAINHGRDDSTRDKAVWEMRNELKEMLELGTPKAIRGQIVTALKNGDNAIYNTWYDLVERGVMKSAEEVTYIGSTRGSKAETGQVGTDTLADYDPIQDIRRHDKRGHQLVSDLNTEAQSVVGTSRKVAPSTAKVVVKGGVVHKVAADDAKRFAPALKSFPTLTSTESQNLAAEKLAAARDWVVDVMRHGGVDELLGAIGKMSKEQVIVLDAALFGRETGSTPQAGVIDFSVNSIAKQFFNGDVDAARWFTASLNKNAAGIRQAIDSRKEEVKHAKQGVVGRTEQADSGAVREGRDVDAGGQEAGVATRGGREGAEANGSVGAGEQGRGRGQGLTPTQDAWVRKLAAAPLKEALAYIKGLRADKLEQAFDVLDSYNLDNLPNEKQERVIIEALDALRTRLDESGPKYSMLSTVVGETHLPEELTSRMHKVFSGSKMVNNPAAPTVKEIFNWIRANVKELAKDRDFAAVMDSVLASPVANLPVVAQALHGEDGKNVVGRYTREETADADTVRQLTLDDTYGLTVDTLLHEVGHAWALVSINDPTEQQKFAERYINEIWKEANARFQEAGSPKHLEYGMSDLHEFVSEFFGNSKLRNFLQGVEPSKTLRLKKRVIDTLEAADDNVASILKNFVLIDSKASNTLASELSDALVKLVSIPETFRWSSQNASKDEALKPDEALAFLKHAFGKDFDAQVVSDLGGKAGMWTEHGIKLASNAPDGVQFHEALHEFFSQLRRHGAPNVIALIERVATNPIMKRKLEQLLEGHEKALAQLKTPEEAAAYMYQFWHKGLLNVGSETKTLFETIQNLIIKAGKKLLSLVDAQFRDQYNAEVREREDLDAALKALATIHSGALANVDARQAIYDALRSNVEAHEKAMANLGKAVEKFWTGMGRVVISNEAMLALQKAHPELRRIGLGMYQTQGTALRNNASKDGDEAWGGYMEAVHAQRDIFLNKFENLMRGPGKDYDDKDIELALKYLEAGKGNSADPKIAKLVDDVRGYLSEMYDYLVQADVRRLDPTTEERWVPLAKRKNYFAQVWDTQSLMDDHDGFVSKLLSIHAKELEHMAKEANAEIAAWQKNPKATITAPTAKAAVDAAVNEAKESGQMMTKVNIPTITPEAVAESIYTRLLNSMGMGEIEETEWSMGITPGASAINRRQLDWLDKEAFGQYKSKDLVNIITTYTSSMVKRAEYQKRFGYGGEKVADAVDRAWLREMGGQELIAKAEAGLEDAIKVWKKAAAEWHKQNPGQVYPEPYPTLRMVGVDLHRAQNGSEKTNEALVAAEASLRPAINAIRAMEGTLGADISEGLRNVNSWITTYENLRTLPFSLFTNMSDVIGVTVQGGTLGDAWDTFVSGIRGVRDSWKKVKSEDPHMKRAEQWGVVEAAALLDSLGQAYGSVFMNQRSKRINDKFFTMIGMTGFNRGIRGAAASVGERIIMNWVANGVDGRKSGERERFERLFGKGAKPEDIALDQDGKLDVNDARNRAAVNRWVADAIMTSNAAHRTAWMSDPHYQTFAHLKNFAYTYHRVMLLGILNQAKLGNFRPALVAGLGYTSIAIAAGAVKEMLLPGDEPAWMKGGLGSYLEYGGRQANLGGVAQLWGEGLLDLDPGRMAGPFWDQAQNLISSPIPGIRVNLSPLDGDTELLKDRTVLGEVARALPAGNLAGRWMDAALK